MPSLRSTPSRDRGDWQLSLAQLLLIVALISGFLAAIICRSVVGVLLVGGGAGIGLVAAGRRYSQGLIFLLGLLFLFATAAVFLGDRVSAARGNAYPRLPVMVEVRDAQNGNPIVGASVSISTADGWIVNAQRGSAAMSQGNTGAITDSCGRAEVVGEFSASTQESYFTFSVTVAVHNQTLRITAPGYQSITVSLHEYTGGFVGHKLDESPLARVRVLLKREKSIGCGL